MNTCLSLDHAIIIVSTLSRLSDLLCEESAHVLMSIINTRKRVTDALLFSVSADGCKKWCQVFLGNSNYSLKFSVNKYVACKTGHSEIPCNLFLEAYNTPVRGTFGNRCIRYCCILWMLYWLGFIATCNTGVPEGVIPGPHFTNRHHLLPIIQAKFDVIYPSYIFYALQDLIMI